MASYMAVYVVFGVTVNQPIWLFMCEDVKPTWIYFSTFSIQ